VQRLPAPIVYAPTPLKFAGKKQIEGIDLKHTPLKSLKEDDMKRYAIEDKPIDIPPMQIKI